MATQLSPYLNFRGQAREVATFYQSVLGGDLQLMTFADMGGMGVPEEEQGRVMHSMLTVSEAVTVMVSDVPSTMPGDFHPGVIALSGDASDTELLRGWFAGLSEGGEVHVPLEMAPWGDWFGQCADRYGVHWMVNIAGGAQE